MVALLLRQLAFARAVTVAHHGPVEGLQVAHQPETRLLSGTKLGQSLVDRERETERQRERVTKLADFNSLID